MGDRYTRAGQAVDVDVAELAAASHSGEHESLASHRPQVHEQLLFGGMRRTRHAQLSSTAQRALRRQPAAQQAHLFQVRHHRHLPQGVSHAHRQCRARARRQAGRVAAPRVHCCAQHTVLGWRRWTVESRPLGKQRQQHQLQQPMRSGKSEH